MAKTDGLATILLGLTAFYGYPSVSQSVKFPVFRLFTRVTACKLLRMKIAFIGIGVMGKSIATHLMDAGHDLTVYTRRKASATELLATGASWANSPAEAGANAEAVFTMVGFPTDVEEVYFGTNGIFKKAKPGTLLIDLTTSKPCLAKRIAEYATEQKLLALDAPVSGGDIGAKCGNLSIMVGGSMEAFEKASPLLSCFGKNIVLQGPAGSGQHTKMCNQIAIASGMVAVCESLAYAQKSGLNPQSVLKSIQNGAAASWSLNNHAQKMLSGDFNPGFYIKHFIKDMGIALEAAESMDLKLPGLELARQLYEKVAKMGYGNEGTQALFRLYQAQSECSVPANDLNAAIK